MPKMERGLKKRLKIFVKRIKRFKLRRRKSCLRKSVLLKDEPGISKKVECLKICVKSLERYGLL